MNVSMTPQKQLDIKIKLGLIETSPMYIEPADPVEDYYRFGWNRGSSMKVETVLRGRWFSWLTILRRGEIVPDSKNSLSARWIWLIVRLRYTALWIMFDRKESVWMFWLIGSAILSGLAGAQAPRYLWSSSAKRNAAGEDILDSMKMLSRLFIAHLKGGCTSPPGLSYPELARQRCCATRQSGRMITWLGPGRRTAYKNSGMIHCVTHQPVIQVNGFIWTGRAEQ